MTTATHEEDILAAKKTKFVLIQSVADYMDCSLHIVYKLIAAGEIPCWKIGAEYRFDPEAVVEWFEDWKRRQIEERKHGKQSA